jgi:dolichol-phosphate mannosyltransferase
VLSERFTNFEILLIDNGSQNRSPEIIHKLLSQFKCVRWIRLSRAVDTETSLTAGLDAAIGDYVVTADPDYDPTAEIIPMIERCRAGCDVVQGVDRATPPPSFVYQALRSIFLRLARWLLKLDVPVETTEFRVFSRSAVNGLTRIRARRRFYSVLASDIGLDTELYPYERISRSGTRSTRNLKRSVKIGLSVLLHYSILPLRLVSVFGLLGSGLSLCYSLYVVIIYFFNPHVQAGWTTLSLQVSGLFALVFLMLALLGECVGRLMEEGMDRPLYHVRDEQSSAVMLEELTRRNVVKSETDSGE